MKEERKTIKYMLIQIGMEIVIKEIKNFLYF